VPKKCVKLWGLGLGIKAKSFIKNIKTTPINRLEFPKMGIKMGSASPSGFEIGGVEEE
jgi:hypothetical protein